jgi:hypothetical protein
MGSGKRLSPDFASGQRRSPLHQLTEKEIDSLKADVKAIGADPGVFEFNTQGVRGTSYNPNRDKVVVTGNVLPDVTSDYPRDRMSSMAVLAHEYYGHRPYRAQYLENPKSITEWADEFRASYMAAKNSPGLSREDRQYLILDAIERAKSAGVTISSNGVMKKLLYGY